MTSTDLRTILAAMNLKPSDLAKLTDYTPRTVQRALAGDTVGRGFALAVEKAWREFGERVDG